MKPIAIAIALGFVTTPTTTLTYKLTNTKNRSLASASAVTPGTKPRTSDTDGPGCPAPTTASPPHTTPGPSECGITTTHTWYGNKTMGCQYDAAGDFCIADGTFRTRLPKRFPKTDVLFSNSHAAMRMYKGHECGAADDDGLRNSAERRQLPYGVHVYYYCHELLATGRAGW
ncbi:hypothetical protein J3459_017007 [Metarhizium acridum]|nr:hypothetical protein J3459_017007 [Metarhizium acridum]